MNRVETNVRRVSEKEAYVLAPGEGERISAVGVTLTFKALGGDTDGRFLASEYVAPPNFPGPPPHWHRESEELFYILEGTVTMQIGDETVQAEPGTTLYVPTGVVHRFANETDREARFLFFAAPAGLGEYFFKLADLIAVEPKWPPDDPEKRQAVGSLAREYDQFPPDTAPATTGAQPIIQRPGEGETLSIRGRTLNFVTSEEKGEGNLTTLIYTAASANEGPPPHHHKETAEAAYILEGAMTFDLEGKEAEAGPGSFVYIPPNVVHSWTNSGGTPIKFVGLALPAGLEGYFREVKAVIESAPAGPPDMDKIAAIAKRYDQYMVEARN